MRARHRALWKARLRRAWAFAREDIWDLEPSTLPAVPALGVKALRVVLLVFRGFREDECPLHASSLTFSKSIGPPSSHASRSEPWRSATTRTPAKERSEARRLKNSSPSPSPGRRPVATQARVASDSSNIFP